MINKGYHHLDRQAPRRKVDYWKAVCLIVAVSFIIVGLVASVLIYSLTRTGLRSNGVTFGEFSAQFAKAYVSVAEKAKRQQIFEENAKRIEQFNREGHTHKLAINEFADLTDAEFAERFSLQPASAFSKHRKPSSPAPSRPKQENTFEEIDWQKAGYVGRIRDQGMCGSCWAFSTVSALESLYAIKNNKSMTEFSEQELVDCATTDYENFGCHGGDPCMTYAYVKSHGISLLSDYPYLAVDSKCQNATTQRAFKLEKGCVDVKANSSASIGEALKARPLSIYITAGAFAFRFYKSGVISDGCGQELGHCVNLVGTGADTETGLKYWRIRNSWGPNWGDHGYLKVVREDEKDPNPGVCGVAMIPNYPE